MSRPVPVPTVGDGCTSRISIALLCILLAITAAGKATAQSCPAYPPEVDSQARTQTLLFTGESGCTNSKSPKDVSALCNIVGGDLLTFQVVTAPGRPLQVCDTLSWTFGDGSPTQISHGSESVSHRFVVASWFAYGFAPRVTITNALGNTVARAAVVFPLPACVAIKPITSLSESFSGPTSKCSPGGGTCAVGEKIAFTVAVADASADPCNFWYVNWGDGTRAETYAIGDPTAAIAPKHFFTTPGTFTATFELWTSAPNTEALPPTAVLVVPVTQAGSAPPKKRRSAHH